MAEDRGAGGSELSMFAMSTLLKQLMIVVMIVDDGDASRGVAVVDVWDL
jgi:hypothetical protein